VIWRSIIHNLGWKLASLLLAVLLWFAIMGEPELVATRVVPVLYKDLPPQLVMVADVPDSVHMELRGPSRKLTAANLSEAAVLLDLAAVSGPGEHTFTLSEANLSLPQGVTFLRAVPSQIRLRFARTRTKEVAVQVRISAPPPAGYRVVRQEVTPDKVRIAGPESHVVSIDAAETDAIDLSAMTRTSAMRVDAFVSDPQVRLESSPIVTVKLTIEKTGNTK